MRHTADCDAGLKAQPPGYRFETAAYDIFQVIAVCSGELEVTTGGGAAAPAAGVSPAAGGGRTMGAGDVLVLRRGGRFTLASPRTGYNGVFFISYSVDETDTGGPPEVVQATRTMEELVGLMLHEAAFPGPTATEVLASLGLALAHSALGEAARHGATPTDPVAEELRLAIRASLQSVTTVGGVYDSAGIGARSGLSYRQVQRRFRTAFGVTPKAYQMAERIREAQRLLSSTRFPITAVAMELGFSSSQHFAAAFRDHTGESPSGYRRRGG